jgi:beta-mannosidase
MFWVELEVKGDVVSTDFASFARPKHLELVDPEIQADIHQSKDGTTAVALTARKPALWAWLDLKNTDASFSDNYFHLQAGKPVTTKIYTREKIFLAEIKEQIQVRSLFDTYSLSLCFLI